MLNSSVCALEKAMTASEHAPEAASTQAVEVSLSEIEAHRELSRHLSTSVSTNNKQTPPSLDRTVDTPRRSRFRYAVLAGAVVIIIIAIIVGTVEGVKSREHAR